MQTELNELIEEVPLLSRIWRTSFFEDDAFGKPNSVELLSDRRFSNLVGERVLAKGSKFSELVKTQNLDIRRVLIGEYGRLSLSLGLVCFLASRILDITDRMVPTCGFVVEFRPALSGLITDSLRLAIKAQSNIPSEQSYIAAALDPEVKNMVIAHERAIKEMQGQIALLLNNQMKSSANKDGLHLGTDQNIRQGDGELNTDIPEELLACTHWSLDYVKNKLLPVITTKRFRSIGARLRKNNAITKEDETLRSWTSLKNFPENLRDKLSLALMDFTFIIYKNRGTDKKAHLYCWRKVEIFAEGYFVKIGPPSNVESDPIPIERNGSE